MELISLSTLHSESGTPCLGRDCSLCPESTQLVPTPPDCGWKSRLLAYWLLSACHIARILLHTIITSPASFRVDKSCFTSTASMIRRPDRQNECIIKFCSTEVGEHRMNLPQDQSPQSNRLEAYAHLHRSTWGTCHPCWTVVVMFSGIIDPYVYSKICKVPIHLLSLTL